MIRSGDATTSYELVAQISQLLDQKDSKEARFVAKQLIQEAYRNGYKQAVQEYAVWKDGQQVVGERIMKQLEKTEKVRSSLGQFFHGGLSHNEDLVRQLIFEAVWLATYEGLDLDTICQEVVEQTRIRFPDPC